MELELDQHCYVLLSILDFSQLVKIDISKTHFVLLKLKHKVKLSNKLPLIEIGFSRGIKTSNFIIQHNLLLLFLPFFEDIYKTLCLLHHYSP